MEINHIFVVLTSFSNIKSYSKMCMQRIHKRKNGNTKQMIKKENGGNLKMKKVKERKGIKGITLIALVITIIVLLILAGVSIATLTGKNGILTRANDAKEQTEIGKEKEAISLIYLTYDMNNEEKYNIGETLIDRSVSNGNSWHIIVDNNTDISYGTGWKYISEGTDLLEYGTAKYNWLYNVDTGEIINLEQNSFVELAYGENLAVKDGLEFNLDSLNMDSDSPESWGNVVLNGFNGVEYDEDGNVVSGFSGKEFCFDGVDDRIELYSDSDFSGEGLTIETYGNLQGFDSEYLGNIYKGPIEGSMNAFKYLVGNSSCFAESRYHFQITGVFNQGNGTGSKYQCPNARNDFHIVLNDSISNGESYVTFVLKENGEFFVMLDGKKVAEDKFDEEYVEGYKQYLANNDYPIVVGMSATGDIPRYTKLQTYAIRVYNKALSEEEAIENYNKTVAYQKLLNQDN